MEQDANNAIRYTQHKKTALENLEIIKNKITNL